LETSTLDWLSVSPSGRYIVFNYDNGNTDGMFRYDIDFTNKIKLQYRWDGNGELYSEGGHGDMGYDTDGYEVFVQFISGLGVYSFNLDNPTELGKELLHSPYGGGHISCRNTKRPGWCYITANTDSDGNGLKRIFALELDGTGNENIQNFTQSHIDTGFHDTYGGVSPDGTKIIFNSHWGTANVDTFVVEAE
jgi:Tol biopolymer transport system component